MDGLREQMHQAGYGDIFFDEYYIPLLEELNRGPLPASISSFDDLHRHSSWIGGIAGYIASTLFRGEEIVQACMQKSGSIRRALDVGCGFGGTLVALGRRGVDATGIELDDGRVRGSRTLLRDRGQDGQVISMNIYDKAFRDLEPFDLIITENVIEHVDNPNLFTETLSSKLAPNGVMYIEFPNFRSISGVIADSHFGLPLVTLLPRLQAINAVRSRFGQEAGYDVGEYHSLGFVVNKLKNSGIEIVSAGPHGRACRSLEEFDRLLPDVIRHASDLSAIYPNIQEHEGHFLHDRVWSYIASAAQARSTYVNSNNIGPINDFLADAFVIYARRPS
jgi:SAM-dependent methyltransferase